MLKNFIRRIGILNVMMLLLVVSIIVVAEYIYLQGNTTEAIFLGLWPPTILGFMNYFKDRK